MFEGPPRVMTSFKENRTIESQTYTLGNGKRFHKKKKVPPKWAQRNCRILPHPYNVDLDQYLNTSILYDVY